MSPLVEAALQPRKMPVQARSSVTVEAIAEATIQVLLAVGPDRLTTTRVAKRAGVSVGTLSPYYPNKRALLFSVMEQHLNFVADTVEETCERHHGQALAAMVGAVVRAFLDAKMRRPDVSTALYAVSAELDGPALVARIGNRARVALATMLGTAMDARFEELEFTTQMVYSAMAGTTRTVIEAGASAKMVRALRAELELMCVGYLEKAAARD
jgi:AcrR family transcriptional regulator